MNKCCGNCKHFKNEDVVGWGLCIGFSEEFGVHCSHIGCLSYKTTERITNGWTEITPDNVEGLYDVDPCRLMIATIDSHGNPQYAKCDGMSTALDAMATIGGCYSFVLPELRLEE